VEKNHGRPASEVAVSDALAFDANVSGWTYFSVHDLPPYGGA